MSWGGNAMRYAERLMPALVPESPNEAGVVEREGRVKVERRNGVEAAGKQLGVWKKVCNVLLRTGYQCDKRVVCNSYHAF